MHHISERNWRYFWRILLKTLRGQRKRWLRRWNEWWQKNTWNYDRGATAISKLKTAKSPNNNGIRAEDIKVCDDETREMVRHLFNEIIKKKNFTPDEWNKVKIKVIHKEGDVENVSNYMLKHRMRLFNVTISPTICYAAGTWIPSKEHERIIQSTQRKMLRLIIQTIRKYKKNWKARYWTHRREMNCWHDWKL